MHKLFTEHCQEKNGNSSLEQVDKPKFSLRLSGGRKPKIPAVAEKIKYKNEGRL
jgi:hypothetical protein